MVYGNIRPVCLELNATNYFLCCQNLYCRCEIKNNPEKHYYEVFFQYFSMATTAACSVSGRGFSSLWSLRQSILSFTR